jgi:mono/diheme cytochrome c family protein
LKASGLSIAICLVLFAPAGVSAHTPPSGATLAANPVFQRNCAKCHGKTAKGPPLRGPSLIAEKDSATFAADLRTILTAGKGRMPKYAGKLTPEEINTLVEQIEALRKQ